MKTVCEAGMCAGCAACAEQCPKNAIEIVKGFKSYDAAIDENLCVDCDACRRVCPQNEPTSLSEPLFWKQGWAADEEVRANGASGGAATAIMRAFVERGGVACGCLFRDGDFIFDFAERVDDVAKFAGSKYVKSNPQGKLRRILDLLRSGRKVLFLGLPCQVAGLLNFIPPRWRANLYTVDLICHGTPSIELFKRYLQERGCELDKIAEISFRHKNEFALKREM